MPHIAYRVEGVPPKALAACTPIPAQNPVASSWGLVHVAGSPGTTRVAAGPTQSVGKGDRGWLPGKAKPGANSPDYILPALYVAAPTPNRGQEYGTPGPNDIPVPAISSHSPYAPLSASAPGVAVNPNVLQRVRTRLASGYVTAWPKVAPSWPIFGQGK
jgi:hypothetical protein